LPEDNHVILKNGCTVYVKPFSYSIQTRLNLMAYDQAKALRNVTDINSESAKQFTALFSELADTNMDVLVQSISKITTPGGDAVTDKNQIKEFMDSIESTDHKKVDAIIETLNKASTTVKRKFNCKETGNEFETEVRLDPSDFFVNT